MNLFTPPRAVGRATPPPDTCVACRRTGVPLEPCRLPGITETLLRCVDPGDCRKNWR